MDVRAVSVVRSNSQPKRNKRCLRVAAVTNFEYDRLSATLRADAVEATTSSFVASLFNAQLQTISQKAEGIEERALANSVFSDYSGNWG